MKAHNMNIQDLEKLLALAKCLSSETSAPCNSDAKERAVLVTTAHRGVFFGYATDVSGETIKLKRARNALYWPASNKGFLGLASIGPQEGSRIGPAADIELRNITCVAECSDAAVAVWEKSPWK
ncbi:MAG: hypothetical protein EBR82_83915 [Caulobacteraceae bacterium]|nr:hypothetical protein [Caulobacteraceae bacterium]